jgi:hypothetical protein
MRRLSSFAAVLVLVLSFSGCQRPPTDSADAHASSAGPFRSGPRHDLSQDEEAGGHTLSKHVGRTDDELRQRLEREPNITAASTYTDRETAERVVGMVLEENRDKIARWLSRPGRHPNLVLDYDGDPRRSIGRTLRRGENAAQPCSHAVVILRWRGDSEYYVLTSYPECR